MEFWTSTVGFGGVLVLRTVFAHLLEESRPFPRSAAGSPRLKDFWMNRAIRPCDCRSKGNARRDATAIIFQGLRQSATGGTGSFPNVEERIMAIGD
jgi:hypothetical protein